MNGSQAGGWAAARARFMPDFGRTIVFRPPIATTSRPASGRLGDGGLRLVYRTRWREQHPAPHLHRRPLATHERPEGHSRAPGPACRRPRAAGAAAAGQARFRARRGVRVAGHARRLPGGGARQPPAARPAQGHRPRRRAAAGEHAPLRPRPARQQRAAVGRARHGQVLARQGGACRGAPRAGLGQRQGQGRSQARRDPPRGHRLAAGLPAAPARRPATASSCSATTSPSTRTTPPTSR